MRRARHAKVAVAAETVVFLEEYFGLLDRWNAKINLTALLRPPTDETFDRLFVDRWRRRDFFRTSPRCGWTLGPGWLSSDSPESFGHDSGSRWWSRRSGRRPSP
jgi:hypothetical protein